MSCILCQRPEERRQRAQKERKERNVEEKKGKLSALLPMLVFLLVYLGVGIYFEYIRPVEGGMGFYIMSVVVAFIIALAVAFAQNRKVSFDEKLRLCAKGVGDENIITMIFIFLLAGAFSGIASEAGCASSTANLLLSIIPDRFAVLGIFVIACLISMAMGTSCGTISVMGVLTLGVAQEAGISVPLCFGALVGGAMFGDNLSFISDTTIAATKTQGCQMRDKFKENFLIALPAALVTAAALVVISLTGEAAATQALEFNVWQAIPYLAILVAALIGINVFYVLGGGVILCAVIGVATGTLSLSNTLSALGSGVSGMYETIIVAILVASLGALMKANGGFDAILHLIRTHCKGKRGGQFGIAALSSVIDIATANNTIAIVMAAPIATDIREAYDITPQKTASLLDIFTCVWQGIIPYGAQLLIASGLAGVGATQIIPYLFYPYLLLVSAVIFILLPERKRKRA